MPGSTSPAAVSRLEIASMRGVPASEAANHSFFLASINLGRNGSRRGILAIDRICLLSSFNKCHRWCCRPLPSALHAYVTRMLRSLAQCGSAHQFNYRSCAHDALISMYAIPIPPDPFSLFKSRCSDDDARDACLFPRPLPIYSYLPAGHDQPRPWPLCVLSLSQRHQHHYPHSPAHIPHIATIATRVYSAQVPCGHARTQV